MDTFTHNLCRYVRSGVMLTLLALPGCTLSQGRLDPLQKDPRGTAIQIVAMHACDLARAEDPSELEPLRATMGALNVLLRDDKADWGVISATFGEIPARSRRYLSLSAAMAKQYAEDVSTYYDGLRHLTAGCLAGLIAGSAVDRRGSPPGREAQTAGDE